MSGTEPSLQTDELMAYVDGQLAPEAVRRVEAALATDEAARAEVEAYRLQGLLLHGAYDKVLAEKVPRRLAGAPVNTSWTRIAMAASVMLVAGAALGWFARGVLVVPAGESTTFAQRAVAAHVVYLPEVRHPVEVVAAEESHLVAWLSKRLAATVRAPVLADFGFRLVGGRLLPAEAGKPAAQFMYEDAQGQRLTLYVSKIEGAQDTAFRYSKEGATDIFYWVDRNLGYALSGAVGRERMLELSNTIYKQLTPG